MSQENSDSSDDFVNSSTCKMPLNRRKSTTVSQNTANMESDEEPSSEGVHCQICEKYFNNHAELINHLYTHAPSNPTTVYESEESEDENFECQKCDLKFRNEREGRIHVVNCHSDELNNVASSVGLAASQEVNKNTKNNERLLCEICSKLFTSKHFANIHRYQEHSDLKNKKIIKTVNIIPKPNTRNFKNDESSNYEKYLVKIMPGSLSYEKAADGSKTSLEPREFVEDKLSNKENRKRKSNVAAKIKLRRATAPPETNQPTLYLCSQCRLHFDTEQALRRHDSNCRELESAVCNKCHLTFPAEELILHTVHYHMDNDVTHFSIKEIKSTKDNKKHVLYKCGLCDDHFLNVTACDSHLYRRRKLSNHSTSGKPCEICQISFPTTSLHQHTLLHHDILGLQKADFVVKVKNVKNNNNESKQTNSDSSHAKKNYPKNKFETLSRQCITCKKTLSSYEERRQAICKVCKEEAPTKKSTRSNPIAQDAQVPSTSASEGVLNIENKNSKHYLFKCSHARCNIHFDTDKALKTHLKLYLCNSEVKSLCNTCDKYFSSSMSLTKHKKRYHMELNLSFSDFKVVTESEWEIIKAKKLLFDENTKKNPIPSQNVKSTDPVIERKECHFLNVSQPTKRKQNETPIANLKENEGKRKHIDTLRLIKSKDSSVNRKQPLHLKPKVVKTPQEHSRVIDKGNKNYKPIIQSPQNKNHIKILSIDKTSPSQPNVTKNTQGFKIPLKTDSTKQIPTSNDVEKNATREDNKKTSNDQPYNNKTILRSKENNSMLIDDASNQPCVEQTQILESILEKMGPVKPNVVVTDVRIIPPKVLNVLPISNPITPARPNNNHSNHIVTQGHINSHNSCLTNMHVVNDPRLYKLGNLPSATNHNIYTDTALDGRNPMPYNSNLNQSNHDVSTRKSDYSWYNQNYYRNYNQNKINQQNVCNFKKAYYNRNLIEINTVRSARIVNRRITTDVQSTFSNTLQSKAVNFFDCRNSGRVSNDLNNIYPLNFNDNRHMDSKHDDRTVRPSRQTTENKLPSLNQEPTSTEKSLNINNTLIDPSLERLERHNTVISACNSNAYNTQNVSEIDDEGRVDDRPQSPSDSFETRTHYVYKQRYSDSRYDSKRYSYDRNNSRKYHSQSNYRGQFIDSRKIITHRDDYNKNDRRCDRSDTSSRSSYSDSKKNLYETNEKRKEHFYKCSKCRIYFVNRNDIGSHVFKHPPPDKCKYLYEECAICFLKIDFVRIAQHMKCHYDNEYDQRYVNVTECALNDSGRFQETDHYIMDLESEDKQTPRKRKSKLQYKGKEKRLKANAKKEFGHTNNSNRSIGYDTTGSSVGLENERIESVTAVSNEIDILGKTNNEAGHIQHFNTSTEESDPIECSEPNGANLTTDKNISTETLLEPQNVLNQINLNTEEEKNKNNVIGSANKVSNDSDVCLDSTVAIQDINNEIEIKDKLETTFDEFKNEIVDSDLTKMSFHKLEITIDENSNESKNSEGTQMNFEPPNLEDEDTLHLDELSESQMQDDLVKSEYETNQSRDDVNENHGLATNKYFSINEMNSRVNIELASTQTIVTMDKNNDDQHMMMNAIKSVAAVERHIVQDQEGDFIDMNNTQDTFSESNSPNEIAINCINVNKSQSSESLVNEDRSITISNQQHHIVSELTGNKNFNELHDHYSAEVTSDNILNHLTSQTKNMLSNSNQEATRDETNEQSADNTDLNLESDPTNEHTENPLSVGGTGQNVKSSEFIEADKGSNFEYPMTPLFDKNQGHVELRDNNKPLNDNPSVDESNEFNDRAVKDKIDDNCYHTNERPVCNVHIAQKIAKKNINRRKSIHVIIDQLSKTLENFRDVFTDVDKETHNILDKRERYQNNLESTDEYDYSNLIKSNDNIDSETVRSEHDEIVGQLKAIRTHSYDISTNINIISHIDTKTSNISERSEVNDINESVVADPELNVTNTPVPETIPIEINVQNCEKKIISEDRNSTNIVDEKENVVIERENEIVNTPIPDTLAFKNDIQSEIIVSENKTLDKGASYKDCQTANEKEVCADLPFEDVSNKNITTTTNFDTNEICKENSAIVDKENISDDEVEFVQTQEVIYFISDDECETRETGLKVEKYIKMVLPDNKEKKTRIRQTDMRKFMCMKQEKTEKKEVCLDNNINDRITVESAQKTFEKGDETSTGISDINRQLGTDRVIHDEIISISDDENATNTIVKMETPVVRSPCIQLISEVIVLDSD